MVDSTKDYLAFFEKMIKAQKDTVNEAWKVWVKKPFPELYEGGFKEFLMEYLDEVVQKQYEHYGVAYIKKDN